MTWRIEHGDCIEVMRSLPDASVDCCVTSPPYWGLRDYGTARWEGGDDGCDHRKPPNGSDPTRGSTLGGRKKTTGHSQESWGESCRKCGAIRIDGQIGLESTPEEYVARMVDVFREVRRVLREDGTCWLNLGDSYAATTKGSVGTGKSTLVGSANHENGQIFEPRKVDIGLLKPKDLVGIPWRVAFALQADGWWLRQDIIWAKPNPMPESVRDRCTKAHEYVFLLTKSARYWWDAKAMKEDCTLDMQRRAALGHTRGAGGKVDASRCDATTLRGEHAKVIDVSDGRNRRSVWTIATQPFSGAHFATMPPKLAELCIRAGCKPGGIVLDPFAGAGTTGLVADRLGRSFVGCEINEDYVGIARQRIASDAPLFAGIEP